MSKVLKWLIFLILFVGITWIAYNYYYYYKAQRLNKDIYVYLEVVLNNLEKSLDCLEKKDINCFLNNNYQMIKHSNYLKDQNQKIYNNIFVKMNLMNGSLFSSELSDMLLWFNNLNTKLNNLYILSNNVFSSKKTFEDLYFLEENLKKTKTALLDINNLTSKQNKSLLNIIEKRLLAEDSFDGLNTNLQNAHSFFDIFGNVFGEKQKTKTLIFFQNPKNINASGGKWIYYLTMTCEKYKCEFSDLDLVANITTAMIDKLIPPEEIKTQKTVWAYEDLGWFFDFNETGRMALKYYPVKTKYDGIMVLSIEIFEEMMKNLNNIDVVYEEKTTNINKLNVVDLLIELSVAKNNKEIAVNLFKVDSFWKEFSKQINKHPESFDIFGKLMFEYINNKKAQIYYEKNVVKSINDLNFNNNLKKINNYNYFSLVRNNILDVGYDDNIIQKVDLKVDILENGQVENTAIILVENKNSSKIRDLVYSYMNLIVNQGSEILETNFPSKSRVKTSSTVDYNKHGFVLDKKIDSINMKTAYLKDDDVRVYEEGDYLVLGGWVITRSNDIKKIVVNWKTLYDLSQNDSIYKLMVQKQPNLDYILNFEISYPSGINNQKNSITKTYQINEDKLIEIKID